MKQDIALLTVWQYIELKRLYHFARFLPIQLHSYMLFKFVAASKVSTTHPKLTYESIFILYLYNIVFFFHPAKTAIN